MTLSYFSQPFKVQFQTKRLQLESQFQALSYQAIKKFCDPIIFFSTILPSISNKKNIARIAISSSIQPSNFFFVTLSCFSSPSYLQFQTRRQLLEPQCQALSNQAIKNFCDPIRFFINSFNFNQPFFDLIIKNDMLVCFQPGKNIFSQQKLTNFYTTCIL